MPLEVFARGLDVMGHTIAVSPLVELVPERICLEEQTNGRAAIATRGCIAVFVETGEVVWAQKRSKTVLGLRRALDASVDLGIRRDECDQLSGQALSERPLFLRQPYVADPILGIRYLNVRALFILQAWADDILGCLAGLFEIPLRELFAIDKEFSEFLPANRICHERFSGGRCSANRVVQNAVEPQKPP